MVENCEACQAYATRQRRETMITGEIPRHPFEIVNQDLFDWRGHIYLVTVDGYSDFSDVTKVSAPATTEKVICVCKRLFGCFGQPKQLRTDSDSRYLSAQFRKFYQDWNIRHMWSEPYHHQASGKSESAVKIAKRLLKKSEAAGEDFELALLKWRSTPQDDGPSPAQKLHCRRTRTALPTGPEDLLPKPPGGVEAIIDARRKQAKTHYDRGAQNLSPLRAGDRAQWASGAPLAAAAAKNEDSVLSALLRIPTAKARQNSKGKTILMCHFCGLYKEFCYQKNCVR